MTTETVPLNEKTATSERWGGRLSVGMAGWDPSAALSRIIGLGVIDRFPTWQPRAAGVADHVWKLEEVVGLLEATEG